MARFDVYRMRSGGTLVLDVQADLLSDLKTRMVVPLYPRTTKKIPIQRLHPVFEIDGKPYLMATDLMAAVPVAELSSRIGNLAAKDAEIGNALDFLLIGF